MKIKKILSLLTFAFLLIPAGVFAKPNNFTISPTQPPAYQSNTSAGSLNTQSQVTVNNVSSETGGFVSSLGFVSCSNSVSLNSGSLVLQGMQGFNLNQPANCFNISSKTLPSQQQNLTVYSSPAYGSTGVTIVINPINTLTELAVFPTSPQSSPVIPAAPILLALEAVGFYLLSRNFAKNRQKLWQNLSYFVSRDRFVILRC